jgi:hypothetical protein
VAVKALKNGQYKISSKADAVKALKMMQERSEEAQELMRENGITELMQEAAELKKAATAYCVDNGITKLDMGDSYASLREDAYDRRWIATIDDFADMGTPAGAIPLRTILRDRWRKKPDKLKEIWNRVTKRVVDPDALQEVIDEGLLDEDEISAAFVEKTKAPYLRIYSKD